MDTKPFKNILKNGWTNFRRNQYLSVAATGIMALVLIVFLGLLGFQFITSEVVVSLQDKVDMSAYFKQDAPEDQILQIKSDVTALSVVANVTYVSREQALQDFKNRHAKDPLIQESLNQLATNPLSASLNIKTKIPGQYAMVADFLEKNKYRPIIDKINFYENQSVIDRIEHLSKAIKNSGLIITLVLAFIAVMVTFNTVRLTIYSQKQEIEIMRLVGASNWHIRGPYLAEGAFYGLIAGGLSLIIFYPIVYFISTKITRFSPTTDLFGYFLGGILQVGALCVALGMLLGMISSFIAIRRYLKI